MWCFAGEGQGWGFGFGSADFECRGSGVQVGFIDTAVSPLSGDTYSFCRCTLRGEGLCVQ